MPRIIFIEHNGRQHEVFAEPGTSAMQAALDNQVPGIVADCGGCCSCATCHGYVAGPWASQMPPASEAEAELVGYAFDPSPQSRLTCQITLMPGLDGMVIRLPRRQI